ncbi:MAG: alpha/beta fold hydrolase [Myxococcota bacterium]
MRLALIGVMVVMGTTFVSTLFTTMVRVYEQQRRPPLRLVAMSALIREWMALNWAVVSTPLAVVPNRPRPPIGPVQLPPVILVPGYGLNRMMFVLLAAYLRRRGRWVWAINNPVVRDDVRAFAAHLKGRVAKMLEVSGAEQVDLVGHSMGGVVSAWYIHHLDRAGSVRRLVTLGTPWRGTKMHIFGFGRQSHELAPGSDVLEGLPAQLGVPVTAIWSDIDVIVLPTQNATPIHGRAVEVDRVGHVEMPLNPKVMRAVHAALSEETQA